VVEGRGIWRVWEELSFGVLEPAPEGLLGVGLRDGVQGVDQEGSALSPVDGLAALGLRRLRSSRDDHAFVVAQLAEAGIAEGCRTELFTGDFAEVAGVEDHDHFAGADAIPPGDEIAA
jgi:hypothetical protein